MTRENELPLMLMPAPMLAPNLNSIYRGAKPFRFDERADEREKGKGEEENESRERDKFVGLRIPINLPPRFH